MDTLKKYGYDLNEGSSQTVKQLRTVIADYFKGIDKIYKTQMTKANKIINNMTVDDMNEIVNSLDWNDEFNGDLMASMGAKADKLGVGDDFEGEY